MEVTGKLEVIGDIQEVSASFKKREFVLFIENERNVDWSDYIKLELTQDNVTALNNFSIGSNVTAQFNLRGRKWEKDGKVNYFNTLQAWKIELVKAENIEPKQDNSAPADDGGESDDLPF